MPTTGIGHHRRGGSTPRSRNVLYEAVVAAGPVPVDVFDSAIATDTVLDRVIEVTDTAIGADTAPSLGKTVTDTAVGADISALTVPVPASDSAVGADLVADRGIAITESGVGTDTAPSLGKTVTDAAAGADIALMAADLVATDVASGADTSALTVPIPAADSAVGTDASSLAVALVAADSGLGSDTFTVLAKAVTDAAVGADTWVNTTQVVTDTGSGADTSFLSVPFAVTDGGSGADTILSLARPASDSATASDTVTTLDAGASNAVTDTGTASDVASLTAATFAVSDSGTAADAAILTVGTAAAITTLLPSLTQAATAFRSPFTKVSGNRGSSNEKVSDTSLGLAIGAGVTVPTGHFLLLAAVVDNHTNTSPGGNSTYLSVTDTKSNIWTRLIEQATDSATALTGIIAGLYMCKVSTALTTGDIITVTVPAASTAKAMGLVEYDVGIGNDMVPVATAGVVANAATSYSVPITGLPSGDYLFIGFSAAEDEVDAAVTLDTGYAEIGLGSIGSGP